MKKLNNVTMSIGRPQGGELNGQDEYVRIEVMDWDSRSKIITMDMELGEFAKLVTGRSDTKVGRALFNDGGHIGKERVSESRRSFISAEEARAAGGSYPSANFEKWLRENRQEEGWFVNPYLGSQGSIVGVADPDGYILNYSVFKYVDIQE